MKIHMTRLGSNWPSFAPRSTHSVILAPLAHVAKGPRSAVLVRRCGKIVARKVG